jgi:RNA polymerase sigma-70 factor (ECF subfamily)
LASDSAQDLVPLTEAGEAIDLDRVYREHAAAVSRWALRLGGHKEVSDTVQEVFEIAQRRLSSFRGESKLTTWLYSITVRVVHARRRKARWRALLSLQARVEFELAPATSETPADGLQRQQATRIVYAVLDRLSERDRTLLVSFELERLTTAEIADILRLSENSVSVGLHRARDRFRQALRANFPDETESLEA